MNFLFLFAQKAAILIPIWIALWIVVRRVKDAKVRGKIYSFAGVATALFVVLAMATTFNVAGPRNEVRKAVIPTGPATTTVIEEKEDLNKTENRLGQFDEKIKAEAPPKQ